MWTVVLEPAAELSFRRFHAEMPGFDDAYAALACSLAMNPSRGWHTSDGGNAYLLAVADKPHVRAVYTYTDTEVLIGEIDAFWPSQ